MNRGLPGKRVLCLMLAAMLLLSAAACGQGSVPDTTVPDPDPAPTEPVPAEPDLPEEPVPEPDPEPEPEPEPWTWNADTPDAQGLRGDALPALHETYASFPLLSAMIVKNGRVVDTYYREGYDETLVFVLNSASKSVTSALVGIAIQRGGIGSVDDLLADYLPRVRELSDPPLAGDHPAAAADPHLRAGIHRQRAVDGLAQLGKLAGIHFRPPLCGGAGEQFFLFHRQHPSALGGAPVGHRGDPFGLCPRGPV